MKEEKQKDLKKILIKDQVGKFEFTDDFLEEENEEGKKTDDKK